MISTSSNERDADPSSISSTSSPSLSSPIPDPAEVSPGDYKMGKELQLDDY